MNDTFRAFVNRIAGLAGMRVVNQKWGPRGPFESLKKAKKAGVVVKQAVDVGASTGIWTREALAVFPDARYFLIDALEQNRPPLEALKQQRPSCDYWIGAVGSAPGTQQFNATGDQSSFFPSQSFPAQKILDLEVRTLDSFLKSGTITPPELIKADIQGFELELLKGAPECLRHAELVLLEVSFHQMYAGAPLVHDIVTWMGANGFRLYDICTYAQRQKDGELSNSDFLFAPARSKLFAYEGW